MEEENKISDEFDYDWIYKDPNNGEVFYGKQFDEEVEWYREDKTLDCITPLPDVCDPYIKRKEDY